MTGKRFGHDCNFKDDKAFWCAWAKPQMCRPSICFYGLGETTEDEINEEGCVNDRETI